MSKPAYHLLDVYGTHLHFTTDRRAWASLRRRHPGLIDQAAGRADEPLAYLVGWLTSWMIRNLPDGALTLSGAG